jgi:ABC-2 type transport system ATP-binding protein
MLRLSDLRKKFGATIAVDGVSLEIRPGEIFGLLGPNGAGKSTTIGMAVGLIRPDSGRVELDGHGSASDRRVRARMGLAPQALAIYDDLTGEENVRFFGRLYGLGGEGLDVRVATVLEQVGLTAKSQDRAKSYSGGMKRRLNLAVALVHDPALILLDEPTAGVDPQSRNNILELVRSLKSRGRTVVYTTHYMEEAQRLCDRVAIIDRGRVLALDTVDNLVGRHGGKTAVVASTPEGEHRNETDDPVRELSALLGRGDVTGVRIERPDLESVFLALTGRSLRD